MQKPKRLFNSLRKIPAAFLMLAVIVVAIALPATRVSAAEASATDEPDTDEYEVITDRTALDQRIADAVAGGQTLVKIDYSGEGWKDLKNWIKEDFRYPILSKYCDEIAIYNYDGASFNYGNWTFEDKKRVEITPRYKLDAEQMAAVNAYAENFINSNGLRGMSPYDQLLTTHNWLIDNFSYESGANNIYQMTQDGLANCYGYTMMNYLIMNKLGVNIRTTAGKVDKLHIWNVVNLDGNWYYEDITWDTDKKNTDYFLISTSKLLKTHTIEGNFLVDCPTDYQRPPAATEEPVATEEPATTEEPAAAEGTSENPQPAEPEPTATASAATEANASTETQPETATAAPETATATPETTAAAPETTKTAPVAAPVAILCILLAAGIILGIRVFRKSTKHSKS